MDTAEPCWLGCWEINEKTHTKCPGSKESSVVDRNRGSIVTGGQKPHEKGGRWPLRSQCGQSSPQAALKSTHLPPGRKHPGPRLLAVCQSPYNRPYDAIIFEE